MLCGPSPWHSEIFLPVMANSGLAGIIKIVNNSIE